MSVFFNGRLLVTPTIESNVDDSAMFNMNSPRISNTVAIIGTALGGKPKTAIVLRSPLDARRRLIGGEGLRAVEKAFAPSAEVGAPARILFMRVNEATQATLNVAGEGGLSGSTVMALTSQVYGAIANQVKVTITKADSGTTRTVTLQSGDAVYSKTKLGALPLTVRYTGSEASATVAVDKTTVKLYAPSNTLVETLTLANYGNVQELTDAINAVPHFTAVALLPTHAVVEALDETPSPLTCKAASAEVRADLRAIIDWINTYCYEVATAAIGTRYVPPGDVAGVFMSGASNGPAVINDDWQDCFDALQEEDAQWVVPLSDSDDIWSMAQAHVQFMSTTGHSERRAFVGGAIGDTKDTAIAAAQVINDDRVALVWPNILDYNEAGQLVEYPAYLAAAQIAGGFGAQNPGNSMTNKTLRIMGLAPLVNSIVDSDDLINGGVMGVRKTRRGFVVSKAVSTWTQDNRFNRVEVSCGAAVDYVVRSVRDALDRFIGAKASPISLLEAASTTESALRSLARPEPVGLGVIVGDAENPAYRNINAEISGDVLRVYFECSPVIPINYILVSVYAKPWSGSISLTTI